MYTCTSYADSVPSAAAEKSRCYIYIIYIYIFMYIHVCMNVRMYIRVYMCIYI